MLFNESARPVMSNWSQLALVGMILLGAALGAVAASAEAVETAFGGSSTMIKSVSIAGIQATAAIMIACSIYIAFRQRRNYEAITYALGGAGLAFWSLAAINFWP
jgi:hypothetical protein